MIYKYIEYKSITFEGLLREILMNFQMKIVAKCCVLEFVCVRGIKSIILIKSQHVNSW